MNKTLQITLLIIAFVSAFLIGFIPAHLKFQSLDQSYQKLESSCNEQISSKDQEINLYKDKLYFADIKSTLASCLIEIEKNNFGIALDNFKLFVEKWQDFKSNKLIQGKITDADIMRDEIVTDLAQNNLKVKDKIITLLEKLQQIEL